MPGLSRTAKTDKLARAIREYRGIKSAATGKWHVLPNLGAKPRVERWLKELGLPLEETLAKIDGFQTGDQFRAWLRSLAVAQQQAKTT